MPDFCHLTFKATFTLVKKGRIGRGVYLKFRVAKYFFNDTNVCTIWPCIYDVIAHVISTQRSSDGLKITFTFLLVNAEDILFC